MADWRVLHTEPNEGLFNVALEKTILEEVSKGNSPPTLIFTEWKPTVSIGNNQSYNHDVDHDACKKYGIGIVRRRSGGQAVYLDDGYFVFSAIAPSQLIHTEGKHDATLLRENFCALSIAALKNLGIPAEFHGPDNIVIKENGMIKTLGNSGQIFKKGEAKEDNWIYRGYFVAQGSIRYKLNDFDKFLDVLKVNGEKLTNHRKDIRDILADIHTYNSKITKDELRREFIRQFEIMYDAKTHVGELTSRERFELKDKYLEEGSIDRILGKENYKAMGVCYFFLGGHNLVPSLEKFMPYRKPSTISDSTIEKI